MTNIEEYLEATNTVLLTKEAYLDLEKAKKSAYQRGCEEAWECARKIYRMTAEEVIAVFGGCSLWVNYSANEAIRMIREYEKRNETRTTDIKRH